jgi:hypothetical protein
VTARRKALMLTTLLILLDVMPSSAPCVRLSKLLNQCGPN